jgi:hypothetical protein
MVVNTMQMLSTQVNLTRNVKQYKEQIEDYEEANKFDEEIGLQI